MNHHLTRKKLIEVALPLDAVNRAAVREKSIRHGHPSTLHLWWARRPLAVARAVLFAQMVDDPAALPELFPTEAEQQRERDRLFRLMEALVQWENTTNEAVLEQARAELRRSWARHVLGAAASSRLSDSEIKARLAAGALPALPAFHDPFAGGGALPLEAQRLGLEAYASDLNPVAVLINKAMIEIPPKFAGQPPVNPEARTARALLAREWRGAQGLAADVRYYGQWMRAEAEKRIGWLYPKVKVTAEMAQTRPDLAAYVGQELTVIAWLWARTVKSPNPAFGQVDVPLVSTFMLSTKAGKEAYVEPVIEGGGYRFTVKVGKPKDAERAKRGTKLARGANFECLMSGTPITSDYIKAEGKAGRMGARLMAIVTESKHGRLYLAPTPEHEAVARKAEPDWKPDVLMPDNPRWFSPPLYGLTTWADLFTPRQLVALTTFSDLVGEAMEKVKADYLAAREEVLGARASCPQTEDEEASRARRPRPQETPPPRVWHRTRLPHFEAGEVAQHITFRLYDSLPAKLLREWEASLSRLGERERDVERRKRIEAAIDQGYGACYLRDPRIAEVVENALRHFDGERYLLHEWVVMPNHVHVLVTPLGGYSLSAMLHTWKSYTAKEANRILGRTGPFWQEDYFDRVIRNERHWVATVAYIRNNPVKAGLCATPEAWRFGSAYFGAREESLGVRASCPQTARASCPQTEDEEASRAGRPRPQAQAYAEAVAMYLAMAVDKCSDYWSSICSWHSSGEKMRNTFGRQAIPMVWDYAEANPFCASSGNWSAMVDWIREALDALPTLSKAVATQRDAATQSLSTDKIISTDPPYYDNIGYADLSDFFYVWLRRTLREVFPDLFATVAVPKAEELIASPYRHGGKQQAERFFLNGMTQALSRLAEQAHPAFPVTIYYAYKQQEIEANHAHAPASTGWETFLDAVMRAGFSITGTWPMRTELGNRMVGRETNALASSVVLVCRKRPADAPTATRRAFVAALKAELPTAVRRLQEGNIAPVDLAQAAIGPGMAVYTRYAKVLDAEGKPVPVREALALINQVLDETLTEQEGDFDAETRWALAWFEQHGFAAGEFGAAETLSKAKNTSVAGLVEAGLLESKRGQVRLLRPAELPAGWKPETAARLTHWAVAHHLIRVLETGGEPAAAALVAKVGSDAAAARELAYRLYTVCERRKRAAEALAYNALVQSFPEIVRLAREAGAAAAQGTLFGDKEA